MHVMEHIIRLISGQVVRQCSHYYYGTGLALAWYC